MRIRSHRPRGGHRRPGHQRRRRLGLGRHPGDRQGVRRPRHPRRQGRRLRQRGRGPLELPLRPAVRPRPACPPGRYKIKVYAASPRNCFGKAVISRTRDPHRRPERHGRGPDRQRQAPSADLRERHHGPVRQGHDHGPPHRVRPEGRRLAQRRHGPGRPRSGPGRLGRSGRPRPGGLLLVGLGRSAATSPSSARASRASRPGTPTRSTRWEPTPTTTASWSSGRPAPDRPPTPSPRRRAGLRVGPSRYPGRPGVRPSR